jgi:type II secretory pathway component PulF
MPNYQCEIIDKDGKTRKETIEASSEEALVEKVQGDGYFLVNFRVSKEKSAAAAPVAAKEKAPKFAHDECQIEDLLIFSRQLATMLEAGVTMLRSLNVIMAQIQSKQLYTAVTQAHNQIEQGYSLSYALAKHPKIFNQFWVSLAEVGEASGTMPAVLNKLAEHVEQESAFQSAIVSAMVYPLILFFVSIGALVFFALFVAPKFESVFKEMHADLPIMTKCLLVTFAFIKKYILLLIGGSIGLFMLLKAYIGTPVGKLQFEKVLYALPVVGDVIKLIVIERFTGQMAILIESGVPILYSLEITEKLVDNKTCSMVVAKVREGVAEGRGMTDSLMRETFFPMMAVQMIKVGEETGELGKMLKHVAKFYQSNVEAFMKRMGTLIEPFMLVFMASMIGVIVISIFMPLFKLGNAAHNMK